jgi:hypothetical protein
LESVRFFQSNLVRRARGDVETMRVCANREFFDNLEKIVRDDARRAHRFQRALEIYSGWVQRVSAARCG